jgi:hypothetical protein
MENFGFGLDDKPKLLDYVGYHLPFYQKLFANRISAPLKFLPIFTTAGMDSKSHPEQIAPDPQEHGFRIFGTG